MLSRQQHVLWLCWQAEEEEEGKEGRCSLTGNCLPGVCGSLIGGTGGRPHGGWHGGGSRE